MEKIMVVEKSTDEDRPTGGISGIVKRFKKADRESESPATTGLVKKAYNNSIEYRGIAGSTRGLMMFFGFLGGGLSLWTATECLLRILRETSRGFFFASLFVIFACFLLYGIYIIVKSVRLELFRPEDEPVIFDRRNRKIYRIYREVYSGWRGLSMRWPLKYAEYDWDLVDAEHQVSVNATGATLIRYHALIFLVRKSSDDPTIVDSFTIGNSIQMGELIVPSVWEHIRRFMEENGPHIPTTEELPKIVEPETFFQCMIAVGPYGKNFRVWVKEYTAFLILAIIFFPIVFPVLTVLGIFTWLGIKTSRPIRWPREVSIALEA